MQGLSKYRTAKVENVLSLAFLVGATFFFATMPARANGCGPLANSYGPFDFRKDLSKLTVVEAYHFTPEVEKLLRGITNTSAGADVDYTLRAFPNHHRALITAIKLSEKEKTAQPRGMRYSVECWLERAVLFAPDDTVARLIYASHLSKINRVSDANAQLEKAEASALDNPFSHYNIGLLYFETKNYEKALTQAHKAMSMGMGRKELADSLRRVGKWQDPPAESASSPAPAASTENAPSTSPK